MRIIVKSISACEGCLYRQEEYSACTDALMPICANNNEEITDPESEYYEDKCQLPIFTKWSSENNGNHIVTYKPVKSAITSKTREAL